MPFTLAIDMTDAFFGTTVALEKRRKFGELYFCKRNSRSDFTIDGNISTRRKEGFVACNQECEKNDMELNVSDFINAPYIKLHSFTL